MKLKTWQIEALASGLPIAETRKVRRVSRRLLELRDEETWAAESEETRTSSAGMFGHLGASAVEQGARNSFQKLGDRA